MLLIICNYIISIHDCDAFQTGFMFIVIIIELMEEDERKLRFLIEMLAVVLIGIIRLLCSLCQVAFMDNDENVIVAIADSIFYTGQVE